VSATQVRQANALICPNCLAPVKSEAQFCPHCGKAISSSRRCRRSGKFWPLWVGVGIAIMVALKGSSRHSETRVATPSAAPQSARAIQLDSEIIDRISTWSDRIDQYKKRSASAQSNRNEIMKSLADAENFDSRLKAAIQRADDENRWPAKVAGKSFLRPDALQAVTRLDQYIAAAHQSIAAYDRTIAQCGAAAGRIDQCRRQLQQNRQHLQQTGSAQELVSVNLELKRLDAVVESAQRDIPTPPAFSPVDIDSLLK
jgi:hypothetical protein